MTAIVIDTITIRQDSEDRFCLNDLHKAAGGEPKHRPGEWLKSGPTSQLISEIERALLHKSSLRRVTPNPGRGYATAAV